jgi:hypothetical protein
MRYLTERLMQTVFLLVGFPLSGLLSPRRSPEMNSMKCDWIPRLRARPLAACAHNTNWDVELRSGGRHARESALGQQHDSATAALIGPRAFAFERSRLTQNGDIGGPTSNANGGGRSSSCCW